MSTTHSHTHTDTLTHWLTNHSCKHAHIQTNTPCTLSHTLPITITHKLHTQALKILTHLVERSYSCVTPVLHRILHHPHVHHSVPPKQWVIECVYTDSDTHMQYSKQAHLYSHLLLHRVVCGHWSPFAYQWRVASGRVDILHPAAHLESDEWTSAGGNRERECNEVSPTLLIRCIHAMYKYQWVHLCKKK